MIILMSSSRFKQTGLMDYSVSKNTACIFGHLCGIYFQVIHSSQKLLNQTKSVAKEYQFTVSCVYFEAHETENNTKKKEFHCAYMLKINLCPRPIGTFRNRWAASASKQSYRLTDHLHTG